MVKEMEHLFFVKRLREQGLFCLAKTGLEIPNTSLPIPAKRLPRTWS